MKQISPMVYSVTPEEREWLDGREGWRLIPPGEHKATTAWKANRCIERDRKLSQWSNGRRELSKFLYVTEYEYMSIARDMWNDVQNHLRDYEKRGLTTRSIWYNVHAHMTFDQFLQRHNGSILINGVSVVARMNVEFSDPQLAILFKLTFA